MRIIVILTFSFLIISCNQNVKKEDSDELTKKCIDTVNAFYGFDEYCEYFLGSKKNAYHTFKKGIKHGPYEIYFNNGTLKEKGEYILGERYALCEKFYSSGRKKSRLEYVVVNYKEYLNQASYYDKEGELIGDSSYYFNSNQNQINSDTIKVNITYSMPMFGDSILVVVGNFNKTFNLNKQNPKIIEVPITKERTISLTRNVKEPLRGYILDYKVNDLVVDSHKLYFSFDI